MTDSVLMPREATREMTMAGCDSLPSCEHVFGHAGEMLRNAYRKMVEVGHIPTDAQPLPERIPVKLTEGAHRLWMAINGHDINDFYERAEYIIKTSLDGLQVGPRNRASVKALLVEHFEQIAKAASQPSPAATVETACVCSGLERCVGEPECRNPVQRSSAGNADALETIARILAHKMPSLRTIGNNPGKFSRAIADEILAALMTAVPQTAPMVPDGYVLVPRELTAENGAKALLIGDFSETFTYSDEDGEEATAEIPVSWTTIKEIHKKMVGHFGSSSQVTRPELGGEK